VGIELDHKQMLANARKTVLVSMSGVVFPWVLGFLIAPFLYDVSALC
jgi:Kef-type K+ transport system membrane component KefB